ncbi:MAG: hypothetical protein QM775_07935 [Pirellulales bacterium]
MTKLLGNTPGQKANVVPILRLRLVWHAHRFDLGDLSAFDHEISDAVPTDL